MSTETNTENTENKENNAAKKSLKSLKKAKRMLKELYSVVEHASLTGAFRHGGAAAAQGYNQILTFVRSQEMDTELTGMFSPLPEDTSYDTVAVATRLLLGYVEGEIEDAKDNDEESDSKVNILLGNAGSRIHLSKGNKHIDLEDLGTIKDIGKIIRDNLPNFIKIEHEESEAERDSRKAARELRDAEREMRDAEREIRNAEREI
jgi:hypothetical protein